MTSLVCLYEGHGDCALKGCGCRCHMDKGKKGGYHDPFGGPCILEREHEGAHSDENIRSIV